MRDGFHVDHGDRGVPCERLDHPIFAIDRPVLELGKRPDANQIDIARQHARDFGHVFFGLAVHHRAHVEFDRPSILAGRQHHRMAAQLESTQFKAGARAHGWIEKQQSDRLAGQLRAGRRALERRGIIEQPVDLDAAPVLGSDEMADGHEWSNVLLWKLACARTARADALVESRPWMDRGQSMAYFHPWDWLPASHGRDGGNKNPARGPGFCRSVQTPMRATAYPAVCGGSDRRARDVIPAAARALVRTITSVEKAVVMFWSKR